jgi:hypothetical protein
VGVVFDGFLIPNSEAGYLIRTASNAPKLGGVVVGASMGHQIIQDLLRHVDEVGQVFYTRYGVE